MNSKNIFTVIIFVIFCFFFCSSCTECLQDRIIENKIKVAVKGKSYSLNPYIAKEQNSLEIRDLLFFEFF